MNRLTGLEKLVLKALHNGENIEQEWNQVLRISDFGTLPHSINRSLPLIFNSLRGQTEASEYQRLAGFTKRNWAENVGRLNYVLPILDSAQKTGIKVVVLKGMAISFLRSDFASRVMGDADLLIHKSDEKAFAKIIRDLGFSATYQLNCPHKVSEIYTVIDEFRDKDGNKIDIHSTADPDALFEILWRETVALTYEGIEINIPNPNYLMLHSLSHGFDGVAQSDLMQTSLDFLLLQKYLDFEELEKDSSKLSLQKELQEFLEFFEAGTIGNPGRSRFRRKSIIRELINLKRIRREREINFKLAYLVSRNSNLRRLRYFIWVFLGAPRPLEERWVSKQKGFVKNFSKELKSISEYEIRFGITGDVTRISIDTKNLFFAAHQIYANGKLLGIAQSDSQLVANLLGSKSGNYEISIRQPYGRCQKCTEILTQAPISLY